MVSRCDCEVGQKRLRVTCPAHGRATVMWEHFFGAEETEPEELDGKESGFFSIFRLRREL